MSLRSFHIFFILTALALLGFVSWWSGQRLWRGEDGVHTALFACGVLGLALGGPYLGWFLKKSGA